MARTSVLERQQAEAGIFKGRIAFNRSSARLSDIPINRDLRNAALAAVDKDLVAANMLDTKTGAPSEKIVAELSWERDEILPTPGLLVKGCLDKCNTCEPALQREIELDLERKKLENGMLKRQIELLDKAQEYRCCPAGEEEGSSDE
jgi:hypothetical protein